MGYCSHLYCRCERGEAEPVQQQPEKDRFWHFQDLDTLEEVLNLDRTLEGASGTCRNLEVGFCCNRLEDCDMLDHALIFAVYSTSTSNR